MEANARRMFALTCGTAAAAVIAGVASLIASQPAAASAKFSKDTGKVCGDCHTNPKGNGALTPFGEQFKANGNKLPN